MTYGEFIRTATDEELAADHYLQWECVHSDIPEDCRPCDEYDGCYYCTLDYVRNHGAELRAKSDEELADDQFVFTGCSCLDNKLAGKDCLACKLKFIQSEMLGSEKDVEEEEQ